MDNAITLGRNIRVPEYPARSETLQSMPAWLDTRADTELQTRANFLRSLRALGVYSRVLGGVRLRAYQDAAGEAIARSVLEKRGLSIVVMFPRQSGKNMLQAQLEVYLLTRFARSGAEMVKFSPTYQPQSLNAMRRPNCKQPSGRRAPC